MFDDYDDVTSLREAIAYANRKDGAEYSVSFDSADISGIANAVRGVPRHYINEDGNGVTSECISYLAPLIVGEVFPIFEMGMPKHVTF